MKHRFFAIGSCIAVAAVVTALGCGSGDGSLADVDADAAPQSPTYEQVFTIIQRNCLACHSQGGKNPPLDTCEDVVANYPTVVVQVVDKNRMPPGAWPRLTSEEKLLLSRWDGEAPCNP